MGDPILHRSEIRTILDPSGRVRLGLSFTTAGSSHSQWPIRVTETTRSDTRPHGLPVGSGTGVATHPVAQLTEQVIPTCSLTQHPHRSLHPRALSFHTIYDQNGRLAGVADQNRTYVSGVQYQQHGGVLSSVILGNGTTETYTLNDRLQMVSQNLTRGSEVLQKYDYGYGQIDTNGDLDTSKNNNQLARVESYIAGDKQWTKKMSYDSIGRLSEEKELRGDNGQQVYLSKFDFDRFGNMYRKATNNGGSLAYTPIEDSDVSRATNRFTTNTTYDDAGNVIQDAKFRNRNFSYDANGRMFKTTSTDNTSQANSVYDAGGMRVADKVDGVWRYLVYDLGGKLVEEYGGPTGNSGLKYIFTDWQGSTRATTDNSGNVQTRSDYSAYGEEISVGTGQRTSQQGFGVVSNVRQKYGSTERDDASGLDDTWFRKLENRGGRWTSPDPYNGSINPGNPQTFNRYSYVGNDPANYIDPSGLLMEARTVCRNVWRRAYVDGELDSIWVEQQCGTEWVWVDDVIGDPGHGGSGPPPPPDMNDCEKFLANLFTGKDDMIFSDITDDDPRDVLSGALEGARRDSEGKFQTHNHLYNPPSDAARKTEIFAPAGGQVLNSGSRMSAGGKSQKWTNVYYPATNVTLQFWHVQGAAKTKTPSKEPTSLGTISPDGSWGYMVNGKRVDGLHMHLNAYKGKWTGLLSDDDKEKNYLKLSSLCPKK